MNISDTSHPPSIPVASVTGYGVDIVTLLSGLDDPIAAHRDNALVARESELFADPVDAASGYDLAIGLNCHRPHRFARRTETGNDLTALAEARIEAPIAQIPHDQPRTPAG